MKYLKCNNEVELVEEIPICGCGTRDVCYEWLIEYLEDLKNSNWNKYSYEDENWKFIQIINGFLEELEIVEHGTTCRCSWLTEKGEKILNTLKYMKKYDFDFCPDESTEYGKWFWVEVDDKNEELE